MTIRHRAAALTAILAIALVATLALTGTAHATKRSEGWIHPPAGADLDTFSNIYGSRHDGYLADHLDTSTNQPYWANTLYPRARDILFGYCPNHAGNDRQVYLCQAEWDDFYHWMRAHRDGTKQDWIDQQYPPTPRSTR